MLSLDDVLNSPQDPELLNRHLQNLGLIPAPVTRPAESLVPMTPPKVLSGPPTTVPLKPFTPPRPEHIPAMRSQEMPEAPAMTAPAAAAPADTSSPLVKPMTPPVLSTEQQKQLPLTSPGMEGGSIPFYQQRLDEAIARNKRDSMSDHPSFLGKVGHVLGRVGNIALDTLAPGIASVIPGTDIYNRAEESSARKNLAEEQERESQTGLRTAETDEAKARAEHLRQESGSESLEKDANGNVVGWKGPDGKLHSLTEEATPQAIKDIAQATKGKEPKEQKQNLQQGLAGAIQDAIDNDRDPGSDKAVQQWAKAIKDFAPEKPDTETQEAQRYEDIRKRMTLKQTVSDDEKAWMQAYEKRKTLAPFAAVQAQAPVREESRGDKSFDRNNAAIDKMANPVEQLNARMARLNEALAQNSPTADALIGPELLSIMAGGPGTGLRMTDAEIGRIVHGRGHWDDLRGAIQLWALDPSKANSITPEQRREIRSLVSAVQQKMVAKNNAVGKAREAMLNNQEDPDQHRRIVKELHETLNQIDSGEAGGPPEGKTTVYDPQGTPHYVNSDKVDKFLNDPKYKGWSRNAPSK